MWTRIFVRLDVAQEADAQSLAEMGALDEPGDVGDDERSVLADVDDAEVGGQGREGIVGDERPGRRDAAR